MTAALPRAFAKWPLGRRRLAVNLLRVRVLIYPFWPPATYRVDSVGLVAYGWPAG